MTFPTFVSAMPIQCFALDAIEKSATAIGRRLDAVAWVRSRRPSSIARRLRWRISETQ